MLPPAHQSQQLVFPGRVLWNQVSFLSCTTVLGGGDLQGPCFADEEMEAAQRGEGSWPRSQDPEVLGSSPGLSGSILMTALDFNPTCGTNMLHTDS